MNVENHTKIIKVIVIIMASSIYYIWLALLLPAHTHTLVPAAPTMLAVEPTSSSSLSVKWAACSSDGGSPITGYVVEYYGGSDPGLQTQVFASNVLSTILEHLTPSTEYNVMVSVENAVGRSGPSVTMKAKTKVDGELNFQVVIEELLKTFCLG